MTRPRRILVSSLLLVALHGVPAFQPAGVSTEKRIRMQSSCLHSSPVLLEEAPTKPVAESLPETDETETMTGSTSLPPLLQNMVDERRQFEMNLGRAMDTLRKDYPYMLHKMPDFSIYHDDISVVDPSGVQLTGLPKYRNSFSFVQSLVKFFYCHTKSGINSRMMYDFARSSIRVTWNAVLVPKVVGNRRNALYLDGMSVYKLDSKSGLIVEHTIENLLVNGRPAVPPYGILTALRDDLMGRHPTLVPGVPVGVGAMVTPRVPLR